MSRQHHRPDYYELSASDLVVAKDFYASAFGRTFNDYGPEYAGTKLPEGREFGGLRREPAPEPPLLVLYSANLEATLEAVKVAGGEIVKEPFSFPGGRRFQFIDPAGSELAVWSDAL